jgi:hypothetical protein
MPDDLDKLPAFTAGPIDLILGVGLIRRADVDAAVFKFVTHFFVLGLMVICSNGLAAKCRIGFRQRIQLRRPEIPQRSYLDPYCLVRRQATTGDTSKPQKKMADSFSGELISLSLG